MNHRTPRTLATLIVFGLSIYASGIDSAGALEVLVADRATHSVLRFDATTGASKGVLVSSNSGGLFAPTSMTQGFDGDLFVTSVDTGTGQAQIKRYDATDGTYLGTFVDTGTIEVLASLTFNPFTGTLFAGSLGAGLGTSNVIYQYDSTGAEDTNWGGHIVEGPANGRTGLAFGPDGNLYASEFFAGGSGEGAIRSYDATNDFAPLGTYLAAGANPALYGAGGLLFNGFDLFIASTIGQSVIKDGVAGPFGDPLAYPSSFMLGADGNLLVTSLGNDNLADPIYPGNLFPGAIFKYDITSGATIPAAFTPFITNGASFQPTAMVLSPDLPASSGSDAVPEPSSLVLLSGLAGGFAVIVRRRRRC